MRVYEGTVLTCDSQDHICRYLVENDGRIVHVGDELPEQYQNATRVRLGEKALLPAFTDSHIHFASFATFHAGLNVMNAKSNAEILQMLKVFAATCRDKLLIAFGASPYSVAEGRLVTREELDSVCPNIPVFMVKYDGHTCVINTKLLELVRKKVQNLRGFHEETGEMNQEAFFALSDYVSNSLSPIRLLANMQKAADYMASKGIGMIHSVSGVGFPLDLDVTLESLFAGGLDNGMQMRVYFQTLDVAKAKRRKVTGIGGCFKTALDGCFGSEDAALLEPYEGTDSRGILYYSDETVTEFCKKANREGMQIQLHAIGDAAFDQATRALKAALDDCPRTDHRHTIIHACMPTDTGIQICADYGIVLAVQSAFINWPQEPNSCTERMLGDRAAGLNPFRTYWDKGIVLTAGSDGPCTDPNPIEWIHKACNHSTPEQSLTVPEALRMCTRNGYYGSFDEADRGSLEPGKIADMVILSKSPYAVDVTELDTLQVRQLILGGKPYRKLKQAPLRQVLRGLTGK